MTVAVASPTLEQLVVPGVELSYTGLVVTDPDLEFETFSRLAVAAGRFKTATSFWLGDLLNFGERLYGDRYVDAMEATGLTYDTLTNYASVCRKVARSRRRESLRFGHHAEVASLEPDQQEEWLDAAEANAWNRNELRDRIRDSRQKPPEPEQPRWSSSEPIEALSQARVEEAEQLAHRTLDRPLPPSHPLWETQAKLHARDVLALAPVARATVRDAAERLVREAQLEAVPDEVGEWRLVPSAAFDALVAALAEED